MQIRDYSLPQGWYPRSSKDAEKEITSFLKTFDPPGQACAACVAPHAGWYYSGRLAVMGISSLDRSAQTIAVIGGHLPCDYPALFAMEDAARTPFGDFPIDKELRASFMRSLSGSPCGCAEDRYKDNTVEVLLPIARYFFPKAELLWARFPACVDSYNAGKELSKTAKKLGKKAAVIGSTDLTHYGANYGFLPRGTGDAALRWVRDINDANFIKAVESGDPGEVLARAEQDSSSCSAGAVLGAMGFAAAENMGDASLLEYGTSADLERDIPDSFVGYAAMGWLQK